MLVATPDDVVVAEGIVVDGIVGAGVLPLTFVTSACNEVIDEPVGTWMIRFGGVGARRRPPAKGRRVDE